MAKLRFSKELEVLFENSPTYGIKSKLDVKEQRFTIETRFGRLECKYYSQQAVEELNAFFRGLFHSAYEKRFDEIIARYPDWDDFLKDKDAKRLFARSRKDRQKYM